MAAVQGRSQERPLTRSPAAAIVAAWLAAALAAPPLRAQETPDGGVGLLAAAGARLTSVAGEAALLPGGGVLLRLAPHVAVGGGVWAGRSAVDLDGTGNQLSFGYGGLWLDVVAHPRRRFAPGARVLLGAGNAVIRNTVVGVETDADNALVVEPELTLRMALAPRLGATASGGWRFAVGVDPATGIDSSDLGGWTLALSLTAGPF